MDRQTKIEKFFDAIEDIETFEDGSIVVKWKSNVSHQCPGHMINLADGLQIVRGKQVHLNPVLTDYLHNISFDNLQEEIDQAIQKGKEYARSLDDY